LLIDEADVDGRDKPGHDKDQFQANFVAAIVTSGSINSRRKRRDVRPISRCVV
jgi:hypothetical protein